MFVSASLPALTALVGGLLAAEPPQDGGTLVFETAPIVAWLEGPVRVRGSDASPGVVAPAPPSPAGVSDRLRIGDALAHPFTQLDVGAGGRVVLLVDGTHLVELAGLGTRTIRATSNGYVISGAAPALRALGRRLPGLGEPFPLTSDAGNPAEAGLGATLALAFPDAAVIRDVTAPIRWSWPHADALFDLEVTRIEPQTGSVLEVLERWQNLAGRAHPLFAPLEHGASYRVHLALRSGNAPSAVIADTRVVRVLEQAEVDELGAILGELTLLEVAEAAREPDADPYHPELDVVRARVLESFGLTGEARALWSGLAILFPERPELLGQALRLQASVSAAPPAPPHPE